MYSAYQPYFKRWNYHPKKFLKGNPRTNFREKKRTNNKKNTKTKDGFARRLVAAYNFDALFAITLIPFEFLHVRLVYLIKYIRRADLISIHEICVAITLFNYILLPDLERWISVILCGSFHLSGYECSLYDIIHIKWSKALGLNTCAWSRKPF